MNALVLVAHDGCTVLIVRFSQLRKLLNLMSLAMIAQVFVGKDKD